MINPLRIVMGQINPLVGDVAGNVAMIIGAANTARDTMQADLVVFPELTLTGYPPEDLLLRQGLLRRVEKGLEKLQAEIKGIAVLVGHPSGTVNVDLYNAASLIADGKILATYYKACLPNYSVFDEKRYFVPGVVPCVVDFKGVKLGITICEDIWFAGPATAAADAGAELLINLNASPFRQGKWQLRETEVRQRVIETGLPIVYVNLMGGQDELVFDGCSFALSDTGEKVVRAPAWETGLYLVEVQKDKKGTCQLSGDIVKKQSALSMLYNGLVVGLRDYIHKNGFSKVVLGLSGGIDSALTLALAVDAIGAENVHTVMMPSRYTAQISLDDAQEMAAGLGVDYQIMSIEPVFKQFLDTLSDAFSGTEVDTTEENIQARCRGILLMALSNKTGAMVLSTGNKSEMAVGYSTLYGDMAGGYAPLKDVYKTLVFELSHYRNTLSPIIPERIITRPPSAELAVDQFDHDSLPPYAVLDVLLQQFVEEDWCYEEMIAAGGDPVVVSRVISMVNRNEYKRRQAPPGIRVTSRAFGRDRRYPITSGYTVSVDFNE